MRRRDLLGALGGLILGSGPAGAQQPGRIYRIGVVNQAARTEPQIVAFYTALARLGFVAGKNLEVDEQGYGLKPGQRAPHAAALVKWRADVIVCGGKANLGAAQQATTTIPIVAIDDDMVGEGFARSLAKPGGNVTGVSILASELDGKRLEILLQLLPDARRIGALAGGDTANPARLNAIREAARNAGVEIAIRTAHKPEEIVPALDALRAEGVAGVNVLASALLFFARWILIERAAALRLPAIYQWPQMATEGGLIGYGPSLAHIYGEQVSRMAAAILRGAKPADLPVEQPTRFELVINLKTAKALGLAVPPSLLARADEVIE